MTEAPETELECLRRLAHEAPMNKVFETHKGHKFLGSHSMAWAKASRDWMSAKDEQERVAGIHPDILACHAQFGGDLEDMQRRYEAADDAEVMRIWRSVGLPEYFLGNGGTNHKLVAFADAIRRSSYGDGKHRNPS